MRTRPAKLDTALADLLRDAPRPVDAADIARMLGDGADRTLLVVGVTGSVAVGKTTFCTALAGAFGPARRVEVISTDGFLLPNDTLTARGLIMRKGFPESYDVDLMSAVLTGARHGPASVPGYSHVTYDRARDLDRTIERPDILLVEGLGLAGSHINGLFDLLVYLDAAEADLEAWFVTRFMSLWRAAETDPTSFYTRFRAMGEPDAEAFARQVWTMINLPNLRDHIAPVREAADVVITKAADHSMRIEPPVRAVRP
jgi:type I pantothenate kinase